MGVVVLQDKLAGDEIAPGFCGCSVGVLNQSLSLIHNYSALHHSTPITSCYRNLLPATQAYGYANIINKVKLTTVNQLPSTAA